MEKVKVYRGQKNKVRRGRTLLRKLNRYELLGVQINTFKL
jgi:hypothetical protein